MTRKERAIVKTSDIDPIMQLYMHAKHLASNNRDYFGGTSLEKKPFIYAGMGKPSFPINKKTTKAAITFWERVEKKVSKANTHMRLGKLAEPETQQRIVTCDAVSSYGHPQGELDARKRIVKKINTWYKEKFDEDKILFTVGGAGAIKILFEYIIKQYGQCRVITTSPFYTLYNYPSDKIKLHTINLMEQPGYRLTAKLLEEAIEESKCSAKKDNFMPAVFLMCNPNNPLGTCLNNQELQSISMVLKKHNLLSIFDEAYIEMSFGQESSSIFNVDFPPDTVVSRTLTKGGSFSGERCGVVISNNKKIIRKLTEFNIRTVGHAPKSAQYIYSKSFPKRGSDYLKQSKQFYKTQLDFADKCLKKMGASMPDSKHKIEGAFYILADLSDLIGLNMPKKVKQLLGVFRNELWSGEDVVYYLMFTQKLMVAPLDYSQKSDERREGKCAYVRITCSGGIQEIERIMGRLETCLREARIKKCAKLQKCCQEYAKLLNENFVVKQPKAISNLTTLALKEENTRLQIQVLKFKERFTEQRVALSNKPCKKKKARLSHHKQKFINNGLYRSVIELPSDTKDSTSGISLYGH